MNKRSVDLLDELAKHLRFIQFTLVISCITFLTVVLSDRQTLLSMANQQINDIYDYTSESNWDVNLFQTELDKADETKTLVAPGLRLNSGDDEYVLCLDASCSEPIRFSLSFRPRIFNLDGKLEVDAYAIHRPVTLAQFEKFYDSISAASCIYEISGAQGGEVTYYEGYEYTNPNDSWYDERKIPLDKILIKPLPEAQNANAVDGGSGYTGRILMGSLPQFEGGWELKGVSLVISLIFDKEQGTDYEHYIIPLAVRRQEFRGAGVLNHESWRYDLYKEQFRALDKLTREWGDIDIATAKNIINAEHERTGESFNVVGVEMPADLMLSWGIFLLLGVQIYFYIHLHEFLVRDRRSGLSGSFESFPWLPLSRTLSADLVYYFSVVALPLVAALVVVMINMSMHPLAQVGRYWQAFLGGSLVLVVSGLLVKYRVKEMGGRHANSLPSESHGAEPGPQPDKDRASHGPAG